jgi:hypothetical protein
MDNRKYFKILDKTDLNDIEMVKEYLKISFKNRKAKKDYKLYINIVNIYSHYPETIKELLDNIPSLGYYKDYFYILMFSKNDDLNEYIYNIVINQINNDLNNLKENKEISTLGKWLPRENHKINKNCNFIDKFTEKLYPNITDPMSRRKKYRKMKTMLNEKLGTIESKVCTKQFDKIDFNKVSYNGLKRNKESLIKNEIAKNKLDEYETSKLRLMNISEFTKELIVGNHSIEKMDKLWEINRFRMEIPYIDKLIANSICIIDLSKDTYENGGEYFALGMALLVNHFSLLEKKILVCNNNYVSLNGNIKDKLSQLLRYVGPCKEIDLNKYYQMATEVNTINTCTNIIFITNKKIENIEEKLGDKKITFIQFKPSFDNYDIVYYNGDKLRTIKKYMRKTERKKQESKDINEIIKDSSEFTDTRTPVMIIMVLFLFWVILAWHQYNMYNGIRSLNIL